jgi:CheY-like chemotaxis protein
VNKLPFLYFPTSVAIVDDNRCFLENMSMKLGLDSRLTLYQNPREALLELKKRTYLADNLTQYINICDAVEQDVEGISSIFNYETFYKTIHCQNQYDEIAAVLIDYSMPEMTGIDFCKQIVDLPLKKIMVTGEAGYELAVKAFNAGIIDAFIVKDIAHVFEEIPEVIQRMQQKYFQDFSNQLGLSFNNSLFECQEYFTSLKTFIAEYHIVEYYRIDNFGSYLGFNHDHEAFWFINKPEHSFDDAMDIARYSNETSVITPLAQRSHFLFLFSEIEKRQPVSAWSKYLFPVQNSYWVQGIRFFSGVIEKKFFSLKIKTF